ncbi:MAG: Fe2+-dependent dioxygenase [Leptolyngbyaceae bacterium]|nr:Fe2+-dependent dioxygenase [Leptolyngbyaceae bacterium]
MIICISGVLSPTDVEAIRLKLETESFVDGRTTAGRYARDVKQNQQLSSTSQSAEEIKGAIAQAIQNHPLIQIAARPKTMRPVMISRYQSGMTYGSHVDNALMGNGSTMMRTDLSMTLFLSDPSSYDGGELVIESHQGEQEIKLDAGSAVLYPSSTLHRVEPVTRGVRLAAITWIQSFVRDPNQREILFDLDTVRQSLFDQSGKSREFDMLAKSISNLLRLWSEV